MNFGLQILNASGEVLVDGDYQNHIVLESGTASLSNSTSNSINFSGSYSPSRLLMLYAQPSDYAGQWGWNLSGGNVVGASIVSLSSHSMPWRLVGLPNAPSADTWGMRIFDAAGNVVFDSGLDYQLLSDIQSFAFPNPADTTTIAHASTSSPWYSLTAAVGRRFVNLAPGVNRHDLALYKNNSSIQAGMRWVFSSPLGIIGPWPTNGTLLVGYN